MPGIHHLDLVVSDLGGRVLPPCSRAAGPTRDAPGVREDTRRAHCEREVRRWNYAGSGASSAAIRGALTVERRIRAAAATAPTKATAAPTHSASCRPST